MEYRRLSVKEEFIRLDSAMKLAGWFQPEDMPKPLFKAAR